MYILNLKIPLLSPFEICIHDKNLFYFTKRQLANYIDVVSDIKKDNNYFVLIKTSIKKEYPDIILGRKIIFQNNILNFSINSRLQQVDYQYDFNDCLTIKISFKKKIFYMLKPLLDSNYATNHILFYQVVLYPIFSLYALVNNYFLVHGSLIKLKDKYIVLTGLDGVGKSSLSKELVLNGAKVLADNFVLFNGESFMGLNMPIRLDLDTKMDENIIYKDNNLKEVLFNYSEFKPVKVDKVYFLSIGDKFLVEQIDNNTALQNWQFINSGAGEILEANLFNMPFLYQNIFFKNIGLEENMKFFHLSIPKGKIEEVTKELICQLNI